MKISDKKFLYLISTLTVFLALPCVWFAAYIIEERENSAHNFSNILNKTKVNKPPDCWNPLKASPDELQKYNFPPRPTIPGALKGWKQIVLRNKWIKPTFQLGKKKNTTLSNNWSGIIENKTYSRVVGEWKQPLASSPTQYRPSFSCQWIGLGGKNSPYLIQMGTESDLYCDGSGGYYAWYEIVGTNMDTKYEVIINNFPHKPGDQYYSDVWLTKDSSFVTAHFYMKDLTNGNVCSYAVTGISLSYVSGIESSAEWIVERPSISGNYYYGLPPEPKTGEQSVYPYLPNFNKVPFTFVWAGDANTGFLEHPSFSSNDSDYADMMDPDNIAIMSYPFGFDNSGNFTVYWNNSENAGTGHVIYKDDLPK